MTVVVENPLAFEKAVIDKARATTQEMLQNLDGIDWLNRVQGRLEEEIRDTCAALETVAEIRKQLWAKQVQDFDRSKAVSEVGVL